MKAVASLAAVEMRSCYNSVVLDGAVAAPSGDNADDA
jgi:hypothetical protein